MRFKKLWKYAIEFCSEKKNKKTWIKKTKKIADYIILTIKSFIKRKLIEKHFNNSYLILQKLKQKLKFTENVQFMRLIKKYYSLNLANFANISQLLNKIKQLKKQIDATQIELTKNKRTIICLMITLIHDANYKFLIQLWTTIFVTIDKIRVMLMKKYRQQKHVKE